MAEFCFECYKRYFDENAKCENLVISKDDDLDLCEGCGKYMPIVIKTKERSLFDFLTSWFRK